jgi:hypothetical protein
MAKFNGPIGYVQTSETSPGIWTPTVTERTYYGDVVKDFHRYDNKNMNETLGLSNMISIVADPFAYGNTQNMRYIKFQGSYWEIKSINIQRPRILLTIGGVYNGDTA